MPRDLSGGRNELTVQDNRSKSTIVLYYRDPTTKENVAYSNEMYQRKGRKVVTRLGETRQKYGSRILTGFREGDFVKNESGQQIPLSSDKESKFHDPEWKKLLQERASDMIEILAIHVFESPVEESSDIEAKEDDAEDMEDPASTDGYAEASEDLEKN